MGYFSNGTEAECYQANVCDGCVHNKSPERGGCAVWEAHFLHNYEECNKEDSILNILIPRTKDGIGNETCKMFHASDPNRCPDTLDMFNRRKA